MNPGNRGSHAARSGKSRTLQEGPTVELHFWVQVDPGDEPFFAFHFGNQVNGKLTIDGINSAHYTEDFEYANLVCASYWRVVLGGLKFNGAAVKIVLRAIAIVVSGAGSELNPPWT